MIIYFRILLYLNCYISFGVNFFLFLFFYLRPSLFAIGFLLMFGDPGCPYIFTNEGLCCEVSICARTQVLSPVTRTTGRVAYTREKFISVLCNSLSVNCFRVWLFDLALLSFTAFGFHLPPSHPHSGQVEKERGGQDW